MGILKAALRLQAVQIPENLRHRSLEASGVEVEPIRPENPWVAMFLATPAG